MEEDIAKKLIQKSTINTSEDFTDNLLLKIEETRLNTTTSISKVQLLYYPLLAIIVGGVVFSLMLFLGFLPKLTVFNRQLQFSKTPFLIVFLFTFLVGINHLIKQYCLVINSNRN